jgi:hypothetical protein
MRTIWLVTVVGCLLAALGSSVAQQAKVEPETPKKIVPVIVLKPGETKEQVMCAPCTLLTRGGGLIIRAMGESSEKAEKHERTVWKREGVKVEVPNMGDATTASRAPAYKPLLDKGLSAFVVTVTASKDAKPGMIEMHLADETCSGTCATDFRVLVLAP